MAYLFETKTGESARKTAIDRMCGPGLAPDDPRVERTEKVEVWSSSFSDPGDDWNEYRGFDALGGTLFSVRKTGF